MEDLNDEVDLLSFSRWLIDVIRDMDSHAYLCGNRSIKMWISMFLIWVGYDQPVEPCE